MSLFNLHNYTELLRRALDVGYRYIAFNQLAVSKSAMDRHGDDVFGSEGEGRCLLRHDVDVDLAAAVVMARAEAAMQISSTYFLMWRSPCYNLMSRSGQKYAEEILELGHHVGLHYDQGFDALRQFLPKTTTEQIHQQAHWLEILLNCRVTAVSFHQPSSVILQAGVDCGERLNTYDRNFLRDFHYVSDSNRVFSLWTSTEINSSIDVHTFALAHRWPQNIQLLIHPLWWVYDDTSTDDVWNRALQSNFEQTQQQLLETEKAYGPKREFRMIVAEIVNDSKQTRSDDR